MDMAHRPSGPSEDRGLASAAEAPTRALRSARKPAARVLIIESVGPRPDLMPDMLHSTITLAPLGDLTADLLANVAPDCVIAPLFAIEFDVMDVALRLQSLGYRGKLRAFAPVLPNPRMVTNEVRANWPGLDFDLIELDMPSTP